MNFYFESIQNDVAISDLEYDIEFDRINLLLNTYSKSINIYQESNNSDFETVVLEAGNKITDGIKKIIQNIITFINNCVDKIKTIFMNKKIEKVQKDLETAMKKDPSIKDRVIELNLDESEIQNIEKELRETVKGYSAVKNPNILKQYLDTMAVQKIVQQDIDDLKKYKKNRAKITVGVGLSITALVGVFIGHCNQKKQLLNKIQSNIDKLGHIEFKLIDKINDTEDDNKRDKLRDALSNIDYARNHGRLFIDSDEMTDIKDATSIRELLIKTVKLLHGSTSKSMKSCLSCMNEYSKIAHDIINDTKNT